MIFNYIEFYIGESNFLDKAFFIGVMVKKMLKVYNYEEKPTDRDNFRFKRVETSGRLIYDLFREYYLIQKRSISLAIDNEYYYHKGKYKNSDEENSDEKRYKENFKSLIENNYHEFFKERNVEIGFKKAFKGNWGSQSHTKKLGVVQDLNRLSWNTFISHLRKINLPLDASAKVVGPRLLNSSQWGLIDPVDTPDGGNIGLHKHMSITTFITSGSSSKPLIEWIRANSSLKIIQECTPEYLSNNTKVIVNGNWIGVIDEPILFVDFFKLLRRNGIIPLFISICFDYKYNEINIFTDAGRLTRPIYYIENKKPSFSGENLKEKINSSEVKWTQLVTGFRKKNIESFNIKNNILYEVEELYPSIKKEDNELNKNKAVIEYIDTSEEDSLLIATNVDDLKKNIQVNWRLSANKCDIIVDYLF
jgi:DNA-directed RNA polymerase II subunit RPB2